MKFIDEYSTQSLFLSNNSYFYDANDLVSEQQPLFIFTNK